MQARLRRYVTLAMLAACVLAVVFVVIIDRESQDEGSPTVVAAIEKFRREGYVDYIIHEKLVPGGEVAFYLQNRESNQPNVNADFVKKSSEVWSWSFGGSMAATNLHLGLTNEEARGTQFMFSYIHDTAGSPYGKSPFPMIYGIATNPDITRMTVKDASGMEKQAEMIEVERHFTLFYVFVDKEQGPLFDVIGYDAEGKVVHQDKVDETQMFEASAKEASK